MTLADYKKLIGDNGFTEYPFFNDGDCFLSRSLKFDELDLSLKIYANKLILCRSFYGTYMAWPDDVSWFLSGFFNNISGERDLIKPELTNAIRYAAEMVLSEDPFVRGTIATSFLFSVLESYAKHKLGFKPLDYDYFDFSGKRAYLKDLPVENTKKDLTIRSAIELLQGKDFPISKCLNQVNEFTYAKYMAAGLSSTRWNVAPISERLNLVRNAMLHGETHSFYSMGFYLLMLYTLFHHCEKFEGDGSGDLDI